MAWDDLKLRANCEEEKKIKKEHIYDLKDICIGSRYNFCQYLALALVLDENPGYRNISLYFFELQFNSNVKNGGPDIVRGSYVEDGSVYLRMRGLDKLVRTFFVGDVSDYPCPSGNPETFDLDKD